MENKGQSGLGFGGVLLIVFITLKLCHIIAWSWIWVLAPIWIPIAISIIILGVYGIILALNKKNKS
jgi:hypothetical protein